jgi:fructose-1,6-bisphosphatase/inositol monophosphatase family enzyme
METALRQAGAVARMLQGRVRDEGKSDGTRMPHDNDALRRKRAAKTLADDIVQEILLIAASTLVDPDRVAVDAEEDTPSTARFAAFGRDDGTSLILDPIDGSLEYVAGDDIYSICVGLVRNGIMETALVYFAARDVCYVLDETGRSFVARDFSRDGWAKAQELSTAPHRGRRIYANGRVEADVLDRLRAHGYQVVDDTEMPGGAPDCLLTCFSGESLGYVAHTRQVRDVLIGAIVAGARGGSALTWAGEQLRWPARGRVERAVFLGDRVPDDLVACLTGRA